MPKRLDAERHGIGGGNPLAEELQALDAAVYEWSPH